MSTVQFLERRLTLGILGFMTLVTLGACGPSDVETRHLAEAISAYEEGELYDARSYLGELLESEETSPGVKAQAQQYRNRIRLLERPEYPEQGLDFFGGIARHLELYPDFVGNPWIYERRQEVLYRKERFYTAYLVLVKLTEQSRDPAVLDWANSELRMVVERIEQYDPVAYWSRRYSEEAMQERARMVYQIDSLSRVGSRAPADSIRTRLDSLLYRAERPADLYQYLEVIRRDVCSGQPDTTGIARTVSAGPQLFILLDLKTPMSDTLQPI